MDAHELAMQLLPTRFLDQRGRTRLQEAEEIRMRLGQPLFLLIAGREYALPGGPIEESELMRTLEIATDASLHSVSAAISGGYLSYRGLRIGVCGTAVMQEGELKGFRRYRSIAIRIPRECFGVCDGVLEQLDRRSWSNLLILSPPGVGKTTALRELIRRVSARGLRVGLVDERNEVAAVHGGRASFSLGPHCDVLSGVPKRTGAMMLLRGMNPELIAMDEITQREDLTAIREICGCGVRLLATAHAASASDLQRRPLYRELMQERIFPDVLKIRMSGGMRCYELEVPGA